MRERRGFNLIEVIVMMAIVSMLLVISIGAMRRGSVIGSSKGMAIALKQELGAARARAISTGQAVAVGFPTNGGAQGRIKSIYNLEGFNAPRITRAKNYANEFPDVCMFLGTWSGGSGFTRNAGVVTGGKASRWDLNTWVPDTGNPSSYSEALPPPTPSLLRDHLIVFTPDGSAISNDVPAHNGNYAIIVARGVEYSGAGGLGGPPAFMNGGRNSAPVFNATQAGVPYTVLVSSSGNIDMVTGVPDSTIALDYSVTDAPFSNARVVGAVNPDPQVAMSNIIVRPEITATGQGSASIGDYVTLELWAADVRDGEQLYAVWDVTRPADPGGLLGNFSANLTDRMEWVNQPVDPSGNPFNPIPGHNGGAWRARWTWTPPADAGSNEIFTVNVDIQDSAGDSADIITPPAPIDLRMPPPGEILVESDFTGNRQLINMNLDGSNIKNISDNAFNDTCPSVAQDGTTVAFISDQGGGNDVWVMTIDGTSRRQVTFGGNKSNVRISADASRVAYLNGNTLEVHWLDSGMTVSGLAVVSMAPSVTVNTLEQMPRPCFTPDGEYVLYAPPGLDAIHYVSVDNAADTGVVISNMSHTNPSGGPLINISLAGPSISNNGTMMAISAGTGDSYIASGAFPGIGSGGTAWAQFVNGAEPNGALATTTWHDGVTVVATPNGSGGRHDFYPEVSPEGDRILFTCIDLTGLAIQPDVGFYYIRMMEIDAGGRGYGTQGGAADALIVTPPGLRNCIRAVWVPGA